MSNGSHSYDPQAMMELVRSFTLNADGILAMFSQSRFRAIGNGKEEIESIFSETFLPSLEASTGSRVNARNKFVAILVSNPEEWASASIRSPGQCCSGYMPRVLGACFFYPVELGMDPSKIQPVNSKYHDLFSHLRGASSSEITMTETYDTFVG